MEKRPNKKISMLSIRIDPDLKKGLDVIASNEHRSLTNMVEKLIRNYCEQQGVIIGN